MKRYLKGDAFREFMSVEMSKTLRTWGSFEPFEWNGSSVYSEMYRAKGLTSGPLEKVSAHGLRAGVDFGSFRRDAWKIDQVSINKLTFVLSNDVRRKVELPEFPERDKSFWARLFPQEVEIGKVLVADASFALGSGEQRLLSERGRMTLTPLSGSDGWSVVAEGGDVSLAELPNLSVDVIHARLHEEGLFLTDAGFRFHDTAKMHVTGDVQFDTGKVRLRMGVDQLPADKVFEEDWRQRLLGTIHADVRTTGALHNPGMLRHGGRVWMKDGVLKALPILNRIASYTRTDRFRRLILNEASADFVLQGNTLKLTNLLMRSNGLVQITGTATVSDPFHPTASPVVKGVFQVGVVHGVLKWLPGAERKVFTGGRDGYLWTTMRVQGTLDDLQEDLSPRLTSAAVATAVEQVPEKSFDVSRSMLDGAAGMLGGGLGDVLRGTGGAILDSAEEVLGSGLQFVPMFVPHNPKR